MRHTKRATHHAVEKAVPVAKAGILVILVGSNVSEILGTEQNADVAVLPEHVLHHRAPGMAVDC